MSTQNSFQFQTVAETHTGNIRALNEDACLDLAEQRLWAVADGMGGHDSGDIASQLIIQHLNKFKASRHLGNNIRLLSSSIHRVNNELLKLAEARNSQLIGSTVVVFHVVGHYGVCAWLGDSRLYLLRNGHLKQLSQDHVLANEFQRYEMFPEDEQVTVPQDNSITRAVGGYPDLDIDYLMLEIMPNDIFLLCTDGLTREVSDDELEKQLTWTSIQNGMKKLMKTALKREAKDNITAVLIKVIET